MTDIEERPSGPEALWRNRGEEYSGETLQMLKRTPLTRFPRHSHSALMFSTTLMIIQATTSTSNCIMLRKSTIFLSFSRRQQCAPCNQMRVCDDTARPPRLSSSLLRASSPVAPPTHKYDPTSLELSCCTQRAHQQPARGEAHEEEEEHLPEQV